MIDPTAFKDRLTSDLDQITTELESIATYDATTDNWEAIPASGELGEADENVEADAVEEWNERRATTAALEIEYRDIKRALEKIGNGAFGKCEICQNEIAEARLQFKPTARTCSEHLNDEATLSLN